MLILFAILSAISTVTLLVFSFENIASQCSSIQFFFATIDGSSVTMLIMGIAFFGIITGLCYAGFIWSVFNLKKSDEDDDGDEDF
jgi:hypothetical protein